VFGHDELEARDVVLCELQQQFEQSAHRRQIRVRFRFLNCAIRLLVDLLRREIDLGWLITQQPPAKAGGLVLRTKSPDTRRLNDAS